MKTVFRILVYPFAMVFISFERLISVTSKGIDEITDAWEYWTN